MIATPVLLIFALTTLVLTATPGPGVFYVTARALSQGRRAGFASMFGIEFGEVAWIAAAAVGVAALLATSAAALGFLRFVGAAYLIYLGIQRWRHAEEFAAPRRSSPGRLFAQGFVTQILNPKVAVFAVAFLPQFIDPRQAVVPQVILLGVVYIGVAIVVDTTYVLTASAVSHRFLASLKAQRTTSRFAAGTYVALGLAAAAAGERPAA